jgi:hypothetical protein
MCVMTLPLLPLLLPGQPLLLELLLPLPMHPPLLLLPLLLLLLSLFILMPPPPPLLLLLLLLLFAYAGVCALKLSGTN